MDGIVIHLSSDGGAAIIWCEDQGPLGLVRREDMQTCLQGPLAVGDFVRFDILQEGEIRLCGALSRHGGQAMLDLPHLLRRDHEARRRRRALTLLHGHPPELPRERSEARLCV